MDTDRVALQAFAGEAAQSYVGKSSAYIVPKVSDLKEFWIGSGTVVMTPSEKLVVLTAQHILDEVRRDPDQVAVGITVATWLTGCAGHVDGPNLQSSPRDANATSSSVDAGVAPAAGNANATPPASDASTPATASHPSATPVAGDPIWFDSSASLRAAKFMFYSHPFSCSSSCVEYLRSDMSTEQLAHIASYRLAEPSGPQ